MEEEHLLAGPLPTPPDPLAAAFQRRSIEDLKEHASAFGDAFSGTAQPGMHSVISLMHRTCVDIEKALDAGCGRDDILAAVQPVRSVLAHSPFVARLQDWPRAIPGDHETVEYLMEGRSRCAPHSPHRWVEWYALNTAVAQQHRNKVAWQRGEIAKVAEQGGRVLSLGCGGCPDFAGSPHLAEKLDVVLVDIDADALILARSRLGQARSVTTFNLDAVRGVRAARKLGAFDLIVCGGLFDYLSDDVVSLLLRRFDRLWPAGRVAFTNIVEGNPFRIWMEYLASWFLIHRSEEDMIRLSSAAGIARARVRVRPDQTGLALLCTIVPQA